MKKKTILAIDDEADLLEMVSYQFTAKGYEVVTAGNGVDGLKKLEGLKPDLIILDLNMPQMGGIEFYNKICGPTNKPNFPVLILTARANTEQLFKEMDIDGFMTKPFEIDQLIKEAEIIIQKRSREIPSAGDQNQVLLRDVFIVDSNDQQLSALSLALLKSGYRIRASSGGTSAIERMMAEPPELALVKLGLVDLTGDLVILRLKQMSKTAHIKCILYSSRLDQHDKEVLKNISNKSGVSCFVEYGDIAEVLAVVEKESVIKKIVVVDEP